MKHRSLFFSLSSIMILIFFQIIPVCAESPTISSFSPPVGYQGTATTLTITGTNFNTTSSTVLFMKSGEENVTSATPTTLTSTQIVCKFSSSKLTSMETGSWYLVVINNEGSSDDNFPHAEYKSSTAFTVRVPMTLTSVTPTTARTNNESVEVTVVGTGLSDVAGLQLYNSDYGNVTATDVDPVSSTKVTGTFDLDSVDVDTYEVCVKDEYNTRVCGLSFAITSDAVGSIDLESSPSGASIYLDGTLKGTTPLVIDDLEVGSYKLIIKKDGYTDWTRTVKITNGGTTSYDAVLEAKTTATTATSAPTTMPTATVRTTRISTITVPTTWVTATSTTQESPLDGALVVGAVAVGLFAAMSRRE